ncbi:cupin domain-containing protein [Pseudonocardia sp. NPDC046786]|uniref:cupin domain-containing protein n=1 Tax=Pseudonocardia sp. NPDC046786 TaxID=3155471 RepID=UPI003406DE01
MRTVHARAGGGRVRDVGRPGVAVALDLAPHPEGGWYRRTWASPLTVDTPYGPRPSATAILYLFDGPGRWHRVRSTELWCWHSGPEAELLLAGDGDEPGDPVPLRLGRPGRLVVPGADDRPMAGPGDPAGRPTPDVLPQREVPPGVWQRAVPLGDGPVLVSCVVSPGFDFADFEMR